jgi:hypothetical protein
VRVSVRREDDELWRRTWHDFYSFFSCGDVGNMGSTGVRRESDVCMFYDLADTPFVGISRLRRRGIGGSDPPEDA